jgi:hypothetical protein
MKKLSLLILLVAGTLSVNAKTNAPQAKQAKKQAPAKEIVSVGIHRTVCFGQCPDYKIEIEKGGMTTYTAMRFTPDTGIFRKNIGKKKAKEIIDLCMKYRIDTCREMYENRIPDLPGLNFIIKYKKGKQKIYSAGFGPEFLAEIAAAMDEAGIKKDKTWKKTGMPKLD